MFSPVSFQDVSFPTGITATTLDSIPESFNAWQSYSNVPTASTYTTQSFTTSFPLTALGRWGLAANGEILGVPESGGTSYIWKTSNNTLQVGPNISIGTIRKVLYDAITNSWVVMGGSSLAKVSCVNTSSVTTIANPTNQGSQYASAVVFNGRAYGTPLTGMGVNTSVAIWDLVANTAVTASGALNGNVSRWGAVVTSVGTIYFAPESGGNILEFNPTTGTGTTFGNISGAPGYSITNLPNGNVFMAQLTAATSTKYVINPVNKNIKSFTGSGIGSALGNCVGQDGLAYYMIADTTNANLNAFNPVNESSFSTGITLQRPTSGNRGYQDMFTLADGRLIMMPGQNNAGRVVYVTNSNNPNNNTYSLDSMVNPIMFNGGGL